MLNSRASSNWWAARGPSYCGRSAGRYDLWCWHMCAARSCDKAQIVLYAWGTAGCMQAVVPSCLLRSSSSAGSLLSISLRKCIHVSFRLSSLCFCFALREQTAVVSAHNLTIPVFTSFGCVWYVPSCRPHVQPASASLHACGAAMLRCSTASPQG